MAMSHQLIWIHFLVLDWMQQNRFKGIRRIRAGPEGLFNHVVPRKSRYWVRLPVWSDVCHRGCAIHTNCSMTFQHRAVLSMVLCTIKNPWNNSIRVGHSPDFELPSVAIINCHDYADSDAKQYSFAMPKTVVVQCIHIYIFSLTWSCGSRQRDTTSSGWKFKWKNLAVKGLMLFWCIKMTTSYSCFFSHLLNCLTKTDK